MSFFNGFDLLEPPSSTILYHSSALFFPDLAADDHLHCTLDLLTPFPTITDLCAFSSASTFRRLHERFEAELHLQTLTDRVAALELGLDRALKSQTLDRTYTWTTEIKGEGFDRKYKVTAEKKAGEERRVKWTTEIKGKAKGKDAPGSRTYTFEASAAPAKKAEAVEKKKEKEKVKEKGEKKSCGSSKRIVEIEDEPNPGAIVIRKTFTKRAVDHSKGKRKELSRFDAALIIQLSFRSYLTRRSQVLRSLRELAVAKAKLKELRALFSNFSYRSRLARDTEEQQRFSEKIIVLLLTVDGIEAPDYMVRAAKKSMTVELEAMLEAIDPEPRGKLASFKRRKFDLPEGGLISKEMSVGVAEVVQMIEHED